jgi:hypothetical protein
MMRRIGVIQDAELRHQKVKATNLCTLQYSVVLLRDDFDTKNNATQRWSVMSVNIKRRTNNEAKTTESLFIPIDIILQSFRERRKPPSDESYVSEKSPIGSPRYSGS